MGSGLLYELCHKTGEKKFVCIQCDASFTKNCYLMKHQREVHKSIKRYKCLECLKLFHDHQRLELHMRIHSGERPYACKDCGKTFIQRGHLSRHSNSHKREKLYPCTECGTSFSKKHNLEIHMYDHTGEKPYQCTECKKSFLLKNDLTIHMQNHIEENLLKGMYCEKAFVGIETFKRHMISHDEENNISYQCIRCNNFSSKSFPIPHMKNHPGECLYICRYCEDTISNKPSVYDAYMVTQSDEVPYTCKFCDEIFLEKFNLLLHMKIHNVDNGINNLSVISPTQKSSFKCNKCEEIFSEKFQLRDHLLVHTDEKSIFCPLCDNFFPNYTTYNNHQMEVHFGEETNKEYQCSICNKVLSSESNIQEHMKTHTQEFECNITYVGNLSKENSLILNDNSHTPHFVNK